MYTVGEALLRPSILGVEEDGLAEQLLRSVSMCSPSENQRQLIENIVLCGGTSMMAGMSYLMIDPLQELIVNDALLI